MTLDLRQLRSFVAIAEAGSLGAAAARLHIAQSALSRQVQALEHACRGRLFERGARGMVLTEAGALLRERARFLLAEAARAQEDVAALHEEPGGPVRMAAASSFADILYPALATRVLARLPRVRLELREMLSDAALLGLRQGALDLAVLSLRGPEAGVTARPLCAEQMMLFGRPGDPVLAAAGVPPRLLGRLPLVLPVGVSWLDRLRDQLEPGVALDARALVDGAGAMKALVRAGLGYGVMPRSGIQAELAAGTLAAAPVRGFRLERLLALPAAGRPISRATEAVARIVEETVGELSGAGAFGAVE